MIIGVSGYAGSGKDTVGKIIQYIMGGKQDPFAFSIENAINKPEDYNWVLEDSSNWEIRKFADKLKDIASHITGIDQELFENQEFKRTPLPVEWWTPCDEGLQPMTVRDLLQKLGTDAMRNGLHPNVWVNALMSDYDKDEDDWVVTDTRFPNEATAIKNAGGIIIRIDRPECKPVNAHPSETSLDKWNFDYKIANVSDIFSLKVTVENILKHAKII